MSLVRAAWERRPEGPAYLLPSVTLSRSYISPACVLFDAHISPFGPAELGGFFPSSCGRILQRENPRSSRLEFLEIFFLKTLSLDSAAQAKNFFVFGCGWWYDREIVLLPPLCEYRERLRERLPGNSASGPHSSRRVQAPSRP